ncbi:MAG: hypothetical protein N838_04675 [Thiohalocapsa sp. PB-PSB1]|jgi:hypothetical protein|nr:MAG: hypothetical protein N838_33240 [Thiohalocapsa sp. PB-PSB1]QQO52769.1 MAG: hypothetical protein N838_04675 [Thiohalocapsa sp. PB-PSB1]
MANKLSLTLSPALIAFTFAFATAHAYECDPALGSFPDGKCYPLSKAGNPVPAEISLRIWASCMRGHDPYNAPNCCWHLTPQLAQQLETCGAGGKSWTDKLKDVPWAEVITIIGAAAGG